MHLNSLIQLKDMELYLNASEPLVLCLNKKQHSLNLISESFLQQLNEVLDYIESKAVQKKAHPQQLIILSEKATNFIAGADLKSMQELDEQAMSQLIELGQQTFERLHQSELITIACIHGSCMGGGLELALACDYRIGIAHPQTIFSLPETQLGLLPAWGGCTRLPRIIGLQPALNCILSGQKINLNQALTLGLINAQIPALDLTNSEESSLDSIHQSLEELDKQQPLNKKVYAKASLSTRLSYPLVKRLSLASIRKKTKGHYPAPELALDVILQGFIHSIPSSLKLEKNTFLKLVQSQHTKNLILTFFAKNQADKGNLNTQAPRTLDEMGANAKIAVFGGGIMGSGIAYWFSNRGYEVYIYDLSAELLAGSMKRISDDYSAAKRYGKISVLQEKQGIQRVTPLVLADKNYTILSHCQLIIEAASESLAIKRSLFSSISPYLTTQTLVATNTSAIPLAELYSSVPYPKNLLGLHFFNPVSRMPLIEVIYGKQTSTSALNQAMGLVQLIKKTPIAVKDCSGFLVNRILMPYLMQAQQLFFDGASAQLIDQSMLDLGFPMGPLHLLDTIGIDTAEHVAETLSKAYPERMYVSIALAQLVQNKQLGVKNQRGFYLYPDKAATKEPRHVNPEAKELTSYNNQDNLTISTIQEQLMQALRQEAQLCLDEEVVANSEQLHLALVLGIGFPPFLQLLNPS